MSFKQENKIIVFEEIRDIHRLVIFIYRCLKYKIYFLRVNKSNQNKRWFKKYLQKRFIEKIKFNLEELIFSSFYPDEAYNNINLIYKHISDSSLIVNKIISLFGSKNIELGYKNNINQGLSRFYYINYILNRLNEKFLSAKIAFIPSNGTEAYRTDGCEIYDYRKFYKCIKASGADYFDTGTVGFSAWATGVSYANAVKRKIKTLIETIGFLFWLCLKWATSFTKHSCIKKYYKYAIMIISPKRQFANKIQKVDFLVDGDLIKKEDVIFLSYKKLNIKEKKYLIENRLNYLDNINIFISLKEIKQVLPKYLLLITLFLKENNSILEASLKMLYFYLRWKSLARNIQIKNLITYCDFGFQSIARNIILEQHACRTYHYIDSTNFGCFYTKKNSENKYRFFLMGFIYGDYFISWDGKVSEYIKDSHCIFKDYRNFGCFWAEHIRLIQLKKIKSDFKERLYKQGYREGMKLISVFDSGFHDDSIITYEDGINFLQGILKLLGDLPNIFVVIKEKRNRCIHQKMTNRFREILEVYNKLENHSRCFCIKGGEQRWENSSEIIAFSDLTISFPFVSTTFEALSARKKAIWYDATDKFRDTFYDNIPSLVCHNYEALLNRAKELLFGTSMAEYNDYLDKYVKEKVESYLDGMAISRFRDLLNSSETVLESKSKQFISKS